ncbi:hypothetical protein AhnVgp119 [Adoxophyes honmai nucleopolyhedrovirus]|uniref:Uncharacterized protein n=1 Tax=Adoxophyes honmai nucleopolyhedrovirus TaxID=224399 RepID=Q80LH7_NPVAH|nr:hypothetical protein AhnVgp119 [Adoxophyes honmai nucleopolyhedrovirus]BAC67370.1 hypothetical protein [Adoxophyes honmai nucleopolyhedrovirus]
MTFKYLILIQLLYLTTTTANDELNPKYLLEKCMRTKFQNDTQCEGQFLLDAFGCKIFDFNTNAALQSYATWLILMNNLQYYSPWNGTMLFESMARYSRQITKVSQKNLNRQMRQTSFEIYRHTADMLIKFHTKEILDKTFDAFYTLFNMFPIWSMAGNEYHFNIILQAYSELRYNFERKIDEAALDLITIALNYPLLLLDEKALKTSMYIYYVEKIPKRNHYFFSNLYYKIEKNQILPKIYKFRTENFTFEIRHNNIGRARLVALKNETDYVLANVNKFYKKLKIQPQFHQNFIRGFVYDHKKMYSQFGTLWDISTNNGGYTHMLPNKRIEFHVYFKNAYDTLPWNYGHEVHHSLLYAANLIGDMPSWYVEGSANRFGNRPCFAYDHETLQFFRNKTIEDITKADYSSMFLYGMGSVLVEFLYENYAELLRDMITFNNYTIPYDNKTLNADFDTFKFNLLGRCLNRNKNDAEKFDTKLAYKSLISDVTFASCKNFIRFDFDDVIFIMTRDSLFKENINPYVNKTSQEIIATNQSELDEYSFNWFMAGVIKLALQFFTKNVDFYFINWSSYTYNVNVSCQHQNENFTTAIIEMAFNYDKLYTLTTFKSNKYKDVVSIIENTDMLAATCQLYKPPINFNAPLDVKDFSRKLGTSASFALNETMYDLVVDIYDNTPLHLAAMSDSNLYIFMKSLQNIKNDEKRNLFNKTSLELYESTLRFNVLFKQKNVNKFCYTFIPPFERVNQTVLLVKPAVLKNQTVLTNNSKVLTNSSKVEDTTQSIKLNTFINQYHNITTEPSIIKQDENNFTTIITNNSTTLFIKEYFQEFMLGIILLVFVIIIIILLYILKYLKKTKKKLNQHNSNAKALYNKQKFYDDDETTIKLFY